VDLLGDGCDNYCNGADCDGICLPDLVPAWWRIATPHHMTEPSTTRSASRQSKTLPLSRSFISSLTSKSLQYTTGYCFLLSSNKTYRYCFLLYSLILNMHIHPNTAYSLYDSGHEVTHFAIKTPSPDGHSRTGTNMCHSRCYVAPMLRVINNLGEERDL
jgi:hypothetical protein